MHTTAYCGCGKCCGWEYGAALPLVPLYVPLTRGARRASGTRTWPLVPRARRRGLDGRHSQHGRWVADCMAVYVLETRRHAPPRNAPPMCSDGGGVVLLSRSRQNNTIRDERTRAPPFVVRNKMPARSGHSLYRRAVEHGTSAAIGAAIGAAVTVAVLARSRPLAPTGHGRRGGHGRVWRTGGSASEGKAAALVSAALSAAAAALSAVNAHDAKPGMSAPRTWADTGALASSAALRGAAIGAAAGACCPVRRYWAETAMYGRPYTGVTSTGVYPRPPRPPLLSMEAVSSPLGFVSRLLTLRWRKRLGTVAADTTHLPFGTRLRVPGWGDGVVEDRGGAIKGAGRLDLFHGSHAAALRCVRARGRVWNAPACRRAGGRTAVSWVVAASLRRWATFCATDRQRGVSSRGRYGRRDAHVGHLGWARPRAA